MISLRKRIRKFLPMWSIAAIGAIVLTSCGDVKPLNLPGMNQGPTKFEDMIALAQNNEKMGKNEEAEKWYKAAIDACVSKFGEKDGRTATCVGYLAAYYRDRQDWKLAYEQYKRWKGILQEISPTDPQLKVVNEDLQKVKDKMKQYGLVPDEVLKKRQEKEAAEGPKGKKSKSK